ncbi:MAG: hypothetical protein HQ518_32825 [Rhodopirellula sp.]|nr:hypothetical protein [Rhodopirellula sp.]
MLRQLFSATAGAAFSEIPHRDVDRHRRRLVSVLLRGLVLASVFLGFSSVTYGQFGADLFDEFNSNEGRRVAFDSEDAPPLQRAGNGAANWRARVGHLAFKTFGRSSSITHVEVMPLIPLDNAAFFTDWRMFVDNQGNFGGNLGVGYRQWVEEINHVVGGSFWYDGDDTSTKYFNQLGLSLELMGDDWDAFSNIYIPVGNDAQNLSVRNTNSRFNGTGTSILFDQVRNRGNAMPGVDFQFGFLIPTDFAHEHEVRAYAGSYHFFSDEAKDINGVRVRLQGDINNVMTAQVEMTDDRTFGTNVMFGGSLVLPGSLSSERPAARRRERHLGRFSQRNYNVIVSKHVDTQSGIAAVNPSTSAAYSVAQITADADLPSTSDILLVQAGTTLTSAITLTNGQYLLGEKTGQQIVADGFGLIDVPDFSAGTGTSLIDSVVGNAVTLASNSRVAGLSITNATGHGIIGSGITDVTLSDLTVSGSGLDNLFLQNVAGPLALTGLSLGDATGSSFHLDGTTADVMLAGAISNTMGRSLLIENTSADTTVDLRNATVHDSGSGVLISAVAGDVQLKDVTVTGGTGTGIEVTGNSGTVIFNGLTSVSGTAGPGINVHDTVDLVDIVDDPNTPENESTVGITEGQVFFNEVAITADGQTGLVASNASSLQIINGTITATNSGAVANISDSLIDVRLRSIFADGGPFAVNIADTAGTFAALGDGSRTAGSGGLIQNTATAVTLSNAGTVFLQFVDFDANQHVLSDSGSASITVAASNISNTTGGALTPNTIFVTHNTKGLEISGSNINNNSIGLLDATVDTVDSYSYAFANNSLTTTAGDLFHVTSQPGSEGATLALVGTGNLITLNSAGVDAFDIDWNGPSAITISSNTVTGLATSTTGLRFHGASTTELSTVAVQNNDFRFDGAGGTGVNVVADGPSLLTVGSNTLDFNGQNGLGMSLSLQKAGDVNILSNLFTDDGGAATAVLFPTIADLSKVTIENNLLQFNSSSMAIDRGIIFQAVETGGTISLFGNVDNVITGASTPFFINGASTGGIPVNGGFVP